MDVLCSNGCGAIVANVETDEGAVAPVLAMACEACGVALAQERIAAADVREGKRLATLKMLAWLSDVPSENLPGSTAEQIAHLEQELGTR